VLAELRHVLELLGQGGFGSVFLVEVLSGQPLDRYLREQIFEADGSLRRWVNVYVDGADVRHLAGLETPTPDGIDVVILPAMAGGAAASLAQFAARRAR